MRVRGRVLSLLVTSLVLFAAVDARVQKPEPPMPTEFQIGRETFFDFGPPFQYLDLYVVRAEGGGTVVKRLSLTPAGQACLQPAEASLAERTFSEDIASLLGGVNPCAIPEKQLRKEGKRCKKCLVFSGAVIRMQAQCGGQTRVMDMNVGDRDWFDPSAHTPQHTSWAVHVLEKLDKAGGTSPLDHPAFSIASADGPDQSPTETPDIKGVAEGKYDALFPGTSEKPSAILRAAKQATNNPPTIDVEATPDRPESGPIPGYPPIAKLAGVGGLVIMTGTIDSEGALKDLKVVQGHPMLRGSALDAVGKWRFKPELSGKQETVLVEFHTNCPAEPK